MVKDENFIQISAWMINHLNLKGNELLTYAKENEDIDLLQQAGGVYNHFFYFSFFYGKYVIYFLQQEIIKKAKLISFFYF